MGKPFCASCLADDRILVDDESEGQKVRICLPCRDGDLRTGRWDFAESEEKELAKPPERKARCKGKP